ncbi:nitroreductase family protein [bacterium]|nr:nitroreductase family protein [bacterium]
MSGIIFFKTKSLDIIHHFYHYTLMMEVWLEQPNCYIYKKGNLLLGFLQSDTTETQGIITIFDQNKEVIENAYQQYLPLVIQDLAVNEKFNIYHFYISDPDGRKIEFQTFLHPLPAFKSADETLIERRSIRKFKDKAIEPELMNKVFEICRYSPTSRNSESFYYLVITNKDDIHWLSECRGRAGNPIKEAPMTVLVISDNTKTIRLEQDADIAATYFMLSAFSLGLGTCWITDMNKNEVKKHFEIPLDCHVSCAIPVGYPDEVHKIPLRREVDKFVKYDKFT